MRRSTTRPACKDGATYPCGRRSREALARLADGRPDRMRWLGARPLRPPARRSARPAESISTGGRWRRAGRSPMATMPTPSRRRAQRGAGLWAGSFERPRDWRVEHGGMAESEHDLFAHDAQLAAGDLRLFMTRTRAVVPGQGTGEDDETVRRRPRAEPAPRPHLPGREGHFGAARAGRHGGAGAQEGSDQLAQSADAAAGAGTRRRHDPHRDHRDLPLFRGTAAAAGSVRHAARSARRWSRCGSGAWSSTCSARSPPPSATSIRR